ncbi:MAG: DUF1080 domain-containing protein [Candidatus Cryptobacteroides sp.]
MNTAGTTVLAAGLAAFLCASAAVAQTPQNNHPEPERMTPGMTEFWDPQPAVVEAGEAGSAPSDAIVLFDGKDLSQWMAEDGSEAGWDVHDGVVTVVKGSAGNIRTRAEFGSFQLHLEWMTPVGIEGESQGRGNSGVFLQGLYEVQILDSYRNETYANGMVASIYKQQAPLVNPMRKPGEWNSFDIIYTAPVFKEDGTYLYEPRVTVLMNGVLVQNNTIIRGTTEYIGHPRVLRHGDGPIVLQSHGDPSAPISFRNIWIRNL